jgi:ferritin
MLTPKMEQAFNDQLNMELGASLEYLGMAAWLETGNFKGFAAFMRRQSDEERVHAMKVYDHILDRGGSIVLAALPAPACAFESPRDVFRAAWAREKANTASIHKLYQLSLDEKDFSSQPLLHWFIDEQVEEEQWCEEADGLLEMAGSNQSALLMLDARYETLSTAQAGAAADGP